MINRNDNIIQNKKLGRIIKITDNLTQITMESSRYYKYRDIFYPSVTHVLSYYPKGEGFNTWLKANGDNVDNILQESADKGTSVHTAIEKILLGEKLTWIDEWGNVKYSLVEWLMILRFAEFWNEFKPKLIETEYHIHSNIHKVAGTIDLVLELNGERWILDIKTSNSLHTIYELQTAIYQECWNEHNKDKVTRSGILWLNAKTRKLNKEKMQGKGWSLVTSNRTQQENIDLFTSIYNIYKIENPELKPIMESYPNSVKLNME